MGTNAIQSEQAALSDDERAKFEQDGYLIFDPGLPGEVVDGVFPDLEPRYLYTPGETRYEDDVVYSPGAAPRIRDAWRISEYVRSIALAPKVLKALKEIYGRQPHPFQTLNFPRATQQPTHSDAMHFVPADPTYMCGVWVALEDIDMDNGPLLYYPGSQRLPFTSYDDVGFEGDKDDFPTYSAFIDERNRHYVQYIRDLLAEHDLQPEYGTMVKGQALIWSSNLLHGGAPQEDMSRTRHSQVTHYLFEGSLAYRTPMRTEGKQEYWTEPELIQ